MISSSPIKTPAAPGWFVVVLAACAASAPTKENIYAKFGDEVTLKPPPGSVTDATKTITWKVGDDIAMDLDGGKLFSYRQFNERGHLNNQTGEMTIKSLNYEDTQVYTIEINNFKTNHEIHFFVLDPVPVPTIVSSCSQDTSTCTLTCEGNIVKAEPVNSMWMSGNSGVLHYGNRYNITKQDSLDFKEFTCKMMNPVSQEISKPFPNPLKSPESGPKIYSGLLVFLILLAVVIIVAVFHRIKTGEFFFNKTSMPWEGDFWRNTKGKPPENNGTTTTPLQEQPDEEAAIMDQTTPKQN
ncbi:uncharacterized protein LOC124861613 isoform X3 [Girardinichthys multiradiatus]|uniref:uncharacterized protein LOC124861613 isoform X3 n=1 Tax=Girardinichthys multiradiatus TaxID=208333 RepID=UPI001FAD7EEE|nr:uncharacterized protein LOC124861613 isoform X3 [Girardinichthys multiradiatus]